MSLFKGIVTFGSGMFVAHNMQSTHSSEPFIRADSRGLKVGDKKLIDISEDKTKMTILNIFEFHREFSK